MTTELIIAHIDNLLIFAEFKACGWTVEIEHIGGYYDSYKVHIFKPSTEDSNKNQPPLERTYYFRVDNYDRHGAPLFKFSPDNEVWFWYAPARFLHAFYSKLLR